MRQTNPDHVKQWQVLRQQQQGVTNKQGWAGVEATLGTVGKESHSLGASLRQRSGRSREQIPAKIRGTLYDLVEGFERSL